MDKKISIEVRRYLERELRDYKDNLKLIEELRSDIIEASPAVDLGTPGNQNKGNEAQTNKVYKLITDKQINRFKSICEAIERMLKRLNENQYEFYIRCFEKRQSKVRICMEMPISEPTFHRYKNRIIYYLAEELGYL